MTDYGDDIDIHACPEVWQSPQLVETLGNARWDTKKGRDIIFAANFPVESFDYGYMTECYNAYKSRVQSLNLEGEEVSYRQYTRNIQKALEIKEEMKNYLPCPPKPRTIR